MLGSWTVYEVLWKTSFGFIWDPQSRSFERRICVQTQDLQIFKKFNMSQKNPKEVFHNTAYSVRLTYTYSRSLHLKPLNITSWNF